MFCPQCKAEYRQGFARCADCDVDLVYELPHQMRTTVHTTKEAIASLEGQEFKSLQIWTDPVQCADACLRLRDAGIAYRVTEMPKAPGYRMERRQELQIAVPVSQYEEAKEALGIQIELGEVLPDEDEIQAAMELPDHGDLSSTGDVSHDWDPENWQEEDATVEVWCSDKLRPGDTIELSLRENRIHARLGERDGQHTIFVMPEDENRAREIVREIVEGVPPE